MTTRKTLLMTAVALAAPAFALAQSSEAAPGIVFKVSGDFNNRMNIYTNQASMYRASETIGTQPGPIVQDGVGEAWADIKYRLKLEAGTTDGSAKGVYGVELGGLRFGNAGTGVGRSVGGGYSGDGVNLETRYAYLDLGVGPGRLTFGLQPFAVNTYLWKETAMGIQVAGKTADIGYKVAWMRGSEFFNTAHSDPTFRDADNLLVRADLAPAKDLKLGVFGLYQRKDQNPANGTSAAPTYLLKNFGALTYGIGNIGVDGSAKAGPLAVDFDLIYQFGSAKAEATAAGVTTETKLDVSSFFAHAGAAFNVDPALKLSYTGWYATGDDNATDTKIKNFIATDVDVFDSVIFFEGGYTDDNYFTEAPYFRNFGAIFNKVAADYKATPAMTVGVAAMYVMTAKALPIGAGKTSKVLGTELDAVCTYQLTPNAHVSVNAGYLISGDGMDFFEPVPNGKADANVFRMTARLRFTFGGST